MNKFFKNTLTTLACILFLSSCKNDPALPDNTASFESDQLGVGTSDTEATVKINSLRAISTASNLTLVIEMTGLKYGTDFTTDPAATGSTLTLSVPANSTAASFKVKKTAGIFFDGDEQIKFKIESGTNGLVSGEKKELTLTFAEILAASSTMELAGGGALFPNKVFLDLSGNRQTSVARNSWDLGFSTSDDFRIILNSSNGMMAKALAKTDLPSVTAADTVGFRAQLSLGAVFTAITAATPPAWVSTAMSWIDDPTGDLSKTAIAAVSATATENKVYIIYRGDGPGSPQPSLGWKKIRIIRNGNNYTLQHADIGATTFTEVQIVKDPSDRFQYVHFGNGLVSVEPFKTKWDIAWTGFANTTNFGTGPVPYYFQDIVLQNISGVQTVQVLTSTVTYAAFAEANIAALTFGTNQINIGANWRSGGGPGLAPAIRSDRFYVIKDADGNYYKLKFTSLTANGERGKPTIEFALVKKG